VEDWQTVLDLVAEKGWKCQYSEGERVLPVPRAEAVLSRPADAECPDLRVWPTADVLAIFSSMLTIKSTSTSRLIESFSLQTRRSGE
jgi:hypothetical protein